MRNVSDIFLETIKTHIVCSITFFENRAFNELMWKNVVDPGMPETMSMRISCGISKATDANSSYVIFIVFLPQQWLQKHSSMLRVYVHCLSCSFLG
jgi:hypothetical protein